MTEQQEHLTNLLQQRKTLQEELEQLQNSVGVKKELFWKVQGAIEYLVQTGVTPPETTETEVVVPEEG